MIHEVIAGLDPVKLVYQPASSSPDDTAAPSALAYKEAIEERSNDQIEVDLLADNMMQEMVADSWVELEQFRLLLWTRLLEKSPEGQLLEPSLPLRDALLGRT